MQSKRYRLVAGSISMKSSPGDVLDILAQTRRNKKRL
jgi:hypothetical protein